MQDNALIYGNIRGDAKIWFVGGIFLLAGIIMGLLVPILTNPKPGPSDVLAQGTIIEYAYDEDQNSAPVYSWRTAGGQTLTGQGGIWSNHPSYKIGEAVEIYYSKDNPGNSRINNDKDLMLMNFLLQILGGYFALLGMIILGMKISGRANMKIEVLVGTIASLSFGIPAILVLPGLYFLYSIRPNLIFDSGISAFPQDMLILGIIFSVTGIIDIAATWLLLSHYKMTGSNQVYLTTDPLKSSLK